jgi:hypothetical protein
VSAAARRLRHALGKTLVWVRQSTSSLLHTSVDAPPPLAPPSDAEISLATKMLRVWRAKQARLYVHALRQVWVYL